MTDDSGPGSPADLARRAGFAAVSAAFASLGRVCLALDADFRVRHCSERIDALLGAGTRADVVGLPAEELLGAELFGGGGVLRNALREGERREGWRGTLRRPRGESTVVSLTAAPLAHDDLGACDPEALYLVVLRPADEDVETTAAPTGFGGLVARSPAMAGIFRMVENLQHSEATILLTGESGTGKEVVARAVHVHSPRREGPFVAVSCAALPGELLEAELFGHVRGAFTGAVRDRVGRFEAASGGTLFLDEVGELPLSMQVKLLRVLQERSFERVGETTTRRTDARIIAATNRDLRRAAFEGAFRDDLYYRLRVIPIEIPPLRVRREDIEPLARHLLARVSARAGRSLRLSPDALRALLGYAWPGNVRELENALDYAVAVCQGQTILPEDLPAEVVTTPGGAVGDAPGTPAPAVGAASSGLAAPLVALAPDPERERLRAALEAHQWSRAETARALGMSRTTLWRKMRELGLENRVSTPARR